MGRVADYTLGTAIVMAHVILSGWRERRENERQEQERQDRANQSRNRSRPPGPASPSSVN